MQGSMQHAITFLEISFTFIQHLDIAVLKLHKNIDWKLQQRMCDLSLEMVTIAFYYNIKVHFIPISLAVSYIYLWIEN